MMNVAYVGDLHAFSGIMMSLLSLAKENSNEVLAVYLLSGTFIDKKKHYASLGEKERSFLEGMVQTYQKGSRVYFIDCSDLFVKELGNSVNLKNLYTPYAFMRLLMDLIPSLPDIVLYLDYDTVILSSLHSLYGTPLEGKDFAIAPDQIESRYFLKAKFNTGVMLLNLKQIRQDGCFKKARKAVNSKLMLMPDQTALNAVPLAKKVILETKYNDHVTLHDDTVIRHYTHALVWTPVVHVINVKPWNFSEYAKTYPDEPHQELFTLYKNFKKEYNAL
jgi:Lipopolysaccharide biosynthesis proteins, LPS:glycosyltransferases